MRLHPTRWKILALSLILVLPFALGVTGQASGIPAHASGDWQYQIGVQPDSSIDYATHTYAQTVYRTTYGITAPTGDGTYQVSYWISGDDAAYPYDPPDGIYGNFYQVGIIDDPENSSYWMYIQTTIPSSDGQGGTYMYCETSRGAILGVGALGENDAGCYVPASTYLTPNQYVEFEIYTSSDPAYGSNGPTYGCNGNTHFAVAGVEIGHFADCSNYDGIIDNLPLVVEPRDEAVPIDNNQCSGPDCYSASNSLADFHAIVGGNDNPAKSLASYCLNTGGSIPSGAGAVIYNHDSAYMTTNGGSCSAYSNQSVTRPGAARPAVTPSATPGLPPLRTPPPGASPTPVGGVAAAASRPHPAPNSFFPPPPATPVPRPDISHAIPPTASPTPPHCCIH